MKLVKREEIEHHGILDFESQDRYFKLARERGLMSQKGDFFLMRDGILQNPGSMIAAFYFTSEKAAQNFYNLFLKNDRYRYRVFICRRIKELRKGT